MKRIVERIATPIARLIPLDAHVLGVGTSAIAAQVRQYRRDITIVGLPLFDGHALPFPDHSFDAVTFVDVHADDPTALLREAVRVSRRSIIIKDHSTHWRAWVKAWTRLDLTLIEEPRRDLGLLPWPLSVLSDRHFVAGLDVPNPVSTVRWPSKMRLVRHT